MDSFAHFSTFSVVLCTVLFALPPVSMLQRFASLLTFGALLCSFAGSAAAYFPRDFLIMPSSPFAVEESTTAPEGWPSWIGRFGSRLTIPTTVINTMRNFLQTEGAETVEGWPSWIGPLSR